MTFAIYDFGQRILTPLEPSKAIKQLSEIQPSSKASAVAAKGSSGQEREQGKSTAGDRRRNRKPLLLHERQAQSFAQMAQKGDSKHPTYLEDVMSTQLITGQGSANLHAIHALMISTGVRHLPIVGVSGKLMGLVSDRDILRALLRGSARHVNVQEIMERKVLTAEPRTDIRQGAQVLKEYHIGCLPIVDSQDRLLGIVTRTDLLGVLSTYGPLHLKA